MQMLSLVASKMVQQPIWIAMNFDSGLVCFDSGPVCLLGCLGVGLVVLTLS
jgi:hypothetical protein